MEQQCKVSNTRQAQNDLKTWKKLEEMRERMQRMEDLHHADATCLKWHMEQVAEDMEKLEKSWETRCEENETEEFERYRSEMRTQLPPTPPLRGGALMKNEK